MKLLTKYSRVNVFATGIIFLAAGIAFYFALTFVLLNQVDDDLRIERDEITRYVSKYNRLPEEMKVKDQLISYTPVKIADKKNHFKNVDIKDSDDREAEKFRQLSFGMQAGGQWYEIKVSKSLEDTEDIAHSVLLIFFSTILLMLIASFIINRVLFKKIWNPFYQSLEKLKSFRVNKEEKLSLPPTGTDEFVFMNNTLQTLTQQAQNDYVALKTFSENASHEIQTPIAIIRSKLDLLIQEVGLTQKQSDSLESAYKAVQRLTILNQHLLLLAKIENGQFDAIREIRLDKQLEKKMEDFSELWQIKGLAIHSKVEPVALMMNTDLANILLNNLFSNATKYNYSNGELFIELEAKKLVIKNTSKETPLDNGKMFVRFFKPSQNGDGNGLGLSIIKQICDASGFTVAYDYQENLHVFTINL